MQYCLIAMLALVASPLLAQEKPLEFRDITYATTNGVASQLDVYQQPGNTRAPVLVYFHGGSWTDGNRPKSAGSFREFIAMGFSVLSVDYRMAATARAPGAVQDARCAIAWVKANADQYHFDTHRIVTYGTSAGGQLALLDAMLPPHSDTDPPSCVNVPAVAAVLDFYGPADVSGFAAKSARTRAWLGDSLPPEEMARRMSPMSYVRAGLPPVFIVHGDADPTVPYTQSVALEAALRGVGVPVGMYTVPGGLHGNFSDEQKKIIMARVATFLNEQRLISAPAK
jgi:acetyl esterase/lipase